MHELSIATRLLEIASEHAREHEAQSVRSITLRLGELSCVHKSSLEFSFQLVCEGTLLEGAQLQYIDVPVAIFCRVCDREVELPSIQQFCCPLCSTPSGDIRRGRELDIESMEIMQDAHAGV